MTLTVHIKEKSYQNAQDKTHIVLKNIAFTIPDRQFICIFGPSGCGKTTILNIVAGLEPCPTAQIQFANKKIKKPEIAYVFQEPRLMPWLNVLNNVTLPTDNKKNDQKRALHILTSMGLANVAQEFPNRLSGGMQRRVALARAFITTPDIMLMDEPFVSLDLRLAYHLRKQLLDLWNETTVSILFITHDLNEAIFLADRIIFLGKKPTQILLDYNVTLERPRKNINQEAIEAVKQDLQHNHPHIFQTAS